MRYNQTRFKNLLVLTVVLFSFSSCVSCKNTRKIFMMATIPMVNDSVSKENKTEYEHVEITENSTMYPLLLQIQKSPKVKKLFSSDMIKNIKYCFSVSVLESGKKGFFLYSFCDGSLISKNEIDKIKQINGRDTVEVDVYNNEISKKIFNDLLVLSRCNEKTLSSTMIHGLDP